MDENRTIYRTADFIGKRWTLIILLELNKENKGSKGRKENDGMSGAKRYNELKKAIPNITGKILSERLRELEKEGLIKKHIDSSKFPVKCEYKLTKAGKEFFKIISDLKKWSLKWKFENKLCSSSSCEKCKI